MLNLKKINIWQSEGFWVIDLIEYGQDSETIKVCTESLPSIYLAPQYYKAKLVKYPELPETNNDKATEGSKQ